MRCAKFWIRQLSSLVSKKFPNYFKNLIYVKEKFTLLSLSDVAANYNTDSVTHSTMLLIVIEYHLPYK